MKTKKMISLACFLLFSAQGFTQVQVGEIMKNPVLKYQPHALGIEMNNGLAIRDKTYFDFIGTTYGSDLGLRYTWNFSPYFGWDAIKLKLFHSGNNFQIGLINVLTGIRASTPRFGSRKIAYLYGALRLGGAYYLDEFEIKDENIYENDYWGFKFGFTPELEFGIHFKHLFFGPKYSYLNRMHYIGLNLGIDIGKLVKI